MTGTHSFRTFVVVMVIAGCAGFCLAPAAAQQCPGDCNGTQTVAASELVAGVHIALGEASLASCPAFDANGDSAVDITEITAAVRAALDDCSSSRILAPRAAGIVTIVIGTAMVAADDSGTFDVSLDSGGLDVSGIQIDITYDPQTPIQTDGSPGGSPNCAINPALDKDLFKSFQPGNTARFLVLSLSDVDPIPDGVLFTCNVGVGPFVPVGPYPLTGSNEGASDPDGNPLPTVSNPGAVIVLPSNPTPSPTPTVTPTSTPTPPGGCPFFPSNGCLTAATSSFSLRDDQLTWRWLNGTTSLVDFGYPVAGSTAYSLCVYATQGGSPALALGARVPASSMCSGTFCWRPTGLRGFKYSDGAGNADGITRIRLRAGNGDASIQVKGKGAALPVPTPADPNNLIYQDPSVTVQLRNSDGVCWEAVYPGPARRIDGGQFIDRF